VWAFLTKTRRKVLRLLFGRELYDQLSNLQQTIWQASNRNFDALLRLTPKASLTTVVFSLVEHCNLNCRGCDHFAPLAEKQFLDIGIFERDIHRLAELSGGNVGTIKLMGGEPLLHPEKEKFFSLARDRFPASRVELVTNGMLLKKQPDDFWTACRKNGVTIVPTKYPICIDWGAVKEKTRTEQVAFNFYGSTETELKTSYHIPFDINGTQDTALNFMHCFHANNCRELKDGRLYTCTVMPHMHHFNKTFGKNMILSEADSIDIHKTKDMKNVLEFLAGPVPFCRYCNVLGRTWGHPWRSSKREIEEWTL
jgi:hypothetical protein